MQPVKTNYHSTLANYFAAQPLFFDGELQKKPHIRKCMEQPWQQTKAEMWDEVTNTLCNLDFIQAKACAKMTYELVTDFNDVLEVIPDNAENIRKEKERQARMDKYTRDLIACAKGEITRFELEVPESTTPWPQEKIEDEIERMKTAPLRSDKLRDFLSFLGQEAGTLQNYAREFPYFTLQQAWNYTAGGFVGSAVEKASIEAYHYLLLRNPLSRPKWNPKPQTLKILRGHNNVVSTVRITSDGNIAFSGSSDQTCILWDLHTSQAIHILKGHSGWINAVDITPDGKLALSGSTDMTCIVWDLNTGLPKQTLKGHSGVIRAVAITPDGKLAISGSDDKTCIFWDIYTAQPLKILRGHYDTVNAIAITPDGKIAFSGSSDQNCIHWNLQTGQAIQILKSHFEQINAVEITPDGKLALSGSHDKTCILWDLITGLPIQTLKGHKYQVLSVAITPDGKRVVSGSADARLIFWDLNSGLPVQTFIGHTDFVDAVSIAPDGGKVISGSWDSTCILWNLSDSCAIETHDVHTSNCKAFAFTPNWKQVATSSDYNFTLRNLNTGLQEKTFKGHKNFILDIAITPDGKRAITGAIDKTCIWNLSTGIPVQTLLGHNESVNVITITPDGKRVITGALDKTCILWNLDTGQPLQNLKEHNDIINVITITPDGKRALIGSNDKTFILWNLDTGQPLQTFKGHKGSVNAIAITPDGRRTFIGSFDDKTITLWDFNSGHPILTYEKYFGWDNAIAFTPDGKRIVIVSSHKTCTLRDFKSGKDLACFITNSQIYSVVYSPKGMIIVCKSGDIIFLTGHKKLICPDLPFITIRCIWNYELHKFLPPSADCPLCGHIFEPPESIIKTIIKILHENNIQPDQSPCLELIDEAWEHPGLLHECPNCHEKLKFNPFFGSDIKEITDFLSLQEKEKVREQQFQNKFDEAEKAFKEENWETAYNLYLQLVHQGKFDANVLRYQMALCRLNSLTFNNPEIISDINILSQMLKDKGAYDKAQMITDKLKERLDTIKQEELAKKKATAPWWKKMFGN